MNDGVAEMETMIACSVKINITLRVLSRRPDGLHNIFSNFWSKKGGEELTIYCYNDENTEDILELKGLCIKGPNLVTKALAWARGKGADIPPLHMRLDKIYPPGSGIGAGSGNAAALIKWIRNSYGLNVDNEAIAELGADVAFLASDACLAFAEGIGERLKLLDDAPELTWVLGFPKWKSSTPAAYADLDRYREALGLSVACDAPEEEALDILDKLRKKEFIGFLPNDFADLALNEHKEYIDAFEAAEAGGSLAWGLCGSGSAFFALCGDKGSAKKTESLFTDKSWVIKTARLE